MSRVEKLLTKIHNNGLDGILLTNLDNLRYTSAYTGHAAYIIICEKGRFIITDYRYEEVANEECEGFTVIIRNRVTTTLGQCINSVFDECGLRRVGFESAHLTHAMLQDIKKDVEDVDLIPTANIVEELRYIKDDGEIACIEKAADIADASLQVVIDDVLKEGVSERDVQLELEYQMQKRGSEGMSFETILLSGPRSSLPHGIPSERKIRQGDIVMFDFGAVQQGYRSDMTRTFIMGKPDKQQLEIYKLVKDAQQRGLDTVRAGISGREPHVKVMEVINRSPFAKYAGEGLGHGLGLFLHELPHMGENCDITLEENFVVTVEPGIYIPDWGGIRIEDDVVVTKDGCRLLTKSPKELICL